MSNPIHDLYRVSIAADHAWQAELVRLYGASAGDARYDFRGIATPELLALYVEKRDSYEAYQVAACPVIALHVA